MTERAVWCERCGYRCDPDAATTECFYWDCPLPLTRVRNTGDELGQVLGEALRADGEKDQAR